ncbi:hypothetical protein [Mycobacteroides abscessus]|uniref:hypothetical protein n=1 Tax=Mycobacteroides abscessus TaxID=36809 RepID=UPI0013F619A8|nr:hypothetical protein [Mycobacteroides abscessus]
MAHDYPDDHCRAQAERGQHRVDLKIDHWIRGQDEDGAVSLARTLCMAERGRLGLPLDTVAISGRVKTADEGIDGRTKFPETADTDFPRGHNVWQIKSGKTAPSVSKEINPTKHAALIEAIKNGADYVLFWTNDPIDKQRKAVTTAFTNAVKKIRADANVVTIFADEIEQLCYQHVAVLAQHGPMPISGLVGLEVWARGFSPIEFEPDAPRLAAIDAVRQHVAVRNEPNAILVYGDTGVGKSRLVYEALAQDGVRERVLVARDPSGWNQGLLSDIANTPGSSLILVVDDCDADERRRLNNLVGLCQGRIRLITTGPRTTRERAIEDRRRLELLPLEAQASKNIALSRGLDEQQASLVASLTDGYPGLADALAIALANGGPDSTLLEQIRADDAIGPVFATLISDDEVPALGLVALFERLGFEGDLALELRLACEVFDIDEASVRGVADRELRRFVSTAGRYRRVTPRIFAVWLAARFLQLRSTTIADELDKLPEVLRERIVDQMRQFAGDPVVSRTLGVLLEEAPFTDGAIADVDDGAARLLHVASIVDPATAMLTIERIMNGVTTEQLASVRSGRRDLVQAIEVLLWSGDLFERAATAALRLAMAENEQWSNNATGAVQGIYRVFLGGTGADYARRISWTREALRAHGQAATRIVIPGLASAFDPHETRFATDFGGRVPPIEWRPATFAEEAAARMSAWELLIEIARNELDSRDSVARSLAQGLRTALSRGIPTEALASLGEVEWPPRGRAELIEALNHARTYDEPDPELDAKIFDRITHLTGEGIYQRAAYVFAASVWELSEDLDERVAGLPGPLVNLVEETAVGGVAVWRQIIEIAKDGNADTASRFFEELAKRAPSVEFEVEMETLPQPPLPALVGYLRGLAMVDAVDPVVVLERWITSKDLGKAVLQGIHLLPATDVLAELAIKAVRQGSAPAEEVGRFLYGGWTRPLSADAVAGLLELLVEAARNQIRDGNDMHRTLDQALGIADQWTEVTPVPPVGSRLRSVLTDLLTISEAAEGTPGGSTMVDLHVGNILPRLGLTTAERLEMLLRRLQSLNSFPSDYVLSELDELSRAEPVVVVPAIVEFLEASADGTFHRWSLWLDDAKVLSRIQRVIGPDQLLPLVADIDDPKIWSQLIGHVAFDTDEPDPLLVAILGTSDDAELRGAATVRFMHPHSTAWGPESDNLKGRRETASQWSALPGQPRLFTEWLAGVVEALDQAISSAELREAEER